MSDADQLRRILLERSVRRGDFVLSSGKRSSYYIDCRLTTMSAEGQVLIGRMGLATIRNVGWRPRVIGGLTMGADPVAYAIAAASWGTGGVIDAFSVRKEAKAHGTGQVIEGNFQAGHDVVVVEDVITSGGSAQRAIAAVEHAEGRVVGVMAVVDREQGGRVALESAGYAVVALTTASALDL
ncbi:MAG TPA: orotate phosphoribosyltransferase [Gemmatimonadales bacterium]|nr:orotate phosphoribosyltransferase [Gemmatimonadales bacterium]